MRRSPVSGCRPASSSPGTRSTTRHRWCSGPNRCRSTSGCRRLGNSSFDAALRDPRRRWAGLRRGRPPCSSRTTSTPGARAGSRTRSGPPSSRTSRRRDRRRAGRLTVEQRGLVQYLERLVALDNRAAVRLQAGGHDDGRLERATLRGGGAAPDRAWLSPAAVRRHRLGSAAARARAEPSSLRAARCRERPELGRAAATAVSGWEERMRGDVANVRAAVEYRQALLPRAGRRASPTRPGSNRSRRTSGSAPAWPRCRCDARMPLSRSG